MTDAEFAKATKFILKRSQLWQKVLQLSNWDITYKFTRDTVVDADGESGYAISALCEADWKYLHAIITFCVPELRSKLVPELDKIIVHEMMHIFLCETRGTTEDWLPHEERVASMLASAIVALYRGGMEIEDFYWGHKTDNKFNRFNIEPPPKRKSEILCSHCNNWWPIKDWYEGESFCDTCGEHEAIICPFCALPLDFLDNIKSRVNESNS